MRTNGCRCCEPGASCYANKVVRPKPQAARPANESAAIRERASHIAELYLRLNGGL